MGTYVGELCNPDFVDPVYPSSVGLPPSLIELNDSAQRNTELEFNYESYK